MDRCSVSKVPPILCLVCFGLDKTSYIVETKTLRDGKTQKHFSDFEPEQSSSVTLTIMGKYGRQWLLHHRVSFIEALI